MRQSNILIISFVIFIFVFLGYSFWQSKDTQPFQPVSQEKQAADLREAEKYLENSQAERSLPLIHSYKEEIEKRSPAGIKWFNLFVEASTQMNDSDQLVMLYQFSEEPILASESSSLLLADGLLKNDQLEEYRAVRKKWEGQEKLKTPWMLLDADLFLKEGNEVQAYLLLKDQNFDGQFEVEKLTRLALIKLKNAPDEALELLKLAAQKDPQNLEINLYKARVYESQGNAHLAKIEYEEIASREPYNVFYQDQLAEYYRRQKNFSKALEIWQKIINQTSNDQVWVKSLFWNQVIKPANFDWKNAKLANDQSRQFLVYLLSLKPGEFWNEETFNKVPNSMDALADYQATYWLKLLDALKEKQEDVAFTLIKNSPFQGNSWAPLMEVAFERILNYRKRGVLQIDSDQKNAEFLSSIVNSASKIPTLYIELDKLAQLQLDEGSDFHMPENLDHLLKGDEIFAITLASEGWTESALHLHPIKKFSPSTPEWVVVLYINAIRQNRGDQFLLNFIERQNKTPLITLIEAEIDIAQNNKDKALAKLKGIQEASDDVLTRASWLSGLIEIQKGNLSQAQETIKANSKLANSLQGQEALARIAVLEKRSDDAKEIYQKIRLQSTEAKSYLARLAFEAKDWKEAKELTIALIEEFPGNSDLKNNLKKIVDNEEKNLR